jgi:Ca2+/Na+ antiporter
MNDKELITFIMASILCIILLFVIIVNKFKKDKKISIFLSILIVIVSTTLGIAVATYILRLPL